MRPWYMKLNIPKSKRYKTNQEYLEVMKLVVKEIEEQSKPKEIPDEL